MIMAIVVIGITIFLVSLFFIWELASDSCRRKIVKLNDQLLEMSALKAKIASLERELNYYKKNHKD